MADNDLAAHPKQILARQAYLSTKLGLLRGSALIFKILFMTYRIFVSFNNGLICETSGAYGSISGNLCQAICTASKVYFLRNWYPCSLCHTQ
jgi:hypothetical protein